MTIYLYVKTHLITGLKYLGQTTAKDPHKYSGSGTYWKLHLEKHGYLYNTEILKECKSKDEIKDWGIYYSNLWNVVDSDEWANLTPESGDGGPMPSSIMEKSKNTRKKNGKVRSPESYRKGLETRKRNGTDVLTEEHRRKITLANLGRKRSEEVRQNISKGRKGKGTGPRGPLSEERKQHLSKLNKGKSRSRESIEKQLQTKLEKGQISQIGPIPKLKKAYIDGGYTGPFRVQWITNGVESQVVLVYDKIPEGWWKGRHFTLIPPSQKGKIWITNGVISKMAMEIPEGWWRGMTRKKSRVEQ